VEALEVRTLLSGSALSPGSLDPTFGSNGVVFAVSLGIIDSPAGVAAVQKDGKVVVTTGSSLIRYNQDGSPDTTFGQDGEVIDPMATGNAREIAIRATDGEILVLAGDLTAYTADGKLDTNFGTNGRIVPRSNSNGVETSFALQPNGGILVASSNGARSAVQRYLMDGTLDPNFQVVDSSAVGLSSFTNLVVQSDGKFIVAEDTLPSEMLVPGESSSLLRYNANGTPDNSFGRNGVVGLAGPVNSLAIQRSEDGNSDIGIIVAASAPSFNLPDLPEEAVLQRFNPDGSLDSSFGMLGQIPIDASHIAVEPNGDIVAVSGSNITIYKPTGNIEQSFGSSGQMAVNFGSGTTTVTGIAVDPSTGNLYAVGDSTQNHSHSSSAVSRNLIGGTTTLSNNQLYVTQLYLDLLQRAPDTAGMAGWVAALDQGVSRLQVAQDFVNSSEYHALEVQDLYQKVLRRAADPSGLSTYTNFLNNGGTAAQLEAILLGSDEFFSQHGQNNDSGFLPAVYQSVLNRSIDASGMQFWSQAFNQGESRQAVAAAILASGESDQDVVNMTYARYLHRPADSGGANGWVNNLEQGLTEEQLVANFVSTDEYFAQAVQLPQGTMQPIQSTSQQS
jgi:uncharacterized delta-60 repeat protein